MVLFHEYALEDHLLHMLLRRGCGSAAARAKPTKPTPRVSPSSHADRRLQAGATRVACDATSLPARSAFPARPNGIHPPLQLEESAVLATRTPALLDRAFSRSRLGAIDRNSFPLGDCVDSDADPSLGSYLTLMLCDDGNLASRSLPRAESERHVASHPSVARASHPLCSMTLHMTGLTLRGAAFNIFRRPSVRLVGQGL